MQAIILAAGMGKRLGDLTKDNTKCMIKVNGTYLIDRLLSQLDSLNLERIILVIGYQGEKLRTHIEKQSRNTPIEYIYNPVYNKTNNIYSLYLAKEELQKQDTLLIESDLIFEDTLFHKILNSPYPNLALVAKYEPWMDGTMVRLNTENDIIDFISKKTFRYADIDDYYKTDLHWRQEKLLPAAKTIADAMGAVISDDFTEQELDRDYYGLYYGYAALPVKPEKISYLTNDTIENAVVTNFETNQKTAVYDMEKAAGKDPYEMFLSGSVSLLTIENPSAKTDKELVIFRDSFASSLAPLLIDGYAKITLVDIRYLPSARLGSFVTFDKQDVLFLYSVPVLNNSETIK